MTADHETEHEQGPVIVADTTEQRAPGQPLAEELLTEQPPAERAPTRSSPRAVHVRAKPEEAAAGRGWRSHVLLGAAVFSLMLAVVLPAFVYPRLAALPADPQQMSVQNATGATVLVPDLSAKGAARVMRDAEVRIRTFVSGVGRPVGDSVVWHLATQVDVDGHGLLDARVETVSLDRRTTQPTNCCGDRLVTTSDDPNGEPLVHRGLTSFPFNVRKQSYPMWDIQLKRAQIAEFAGEERRAGMRTYKFVMRTPLASIGTRELPGALFGLPAPSVTARSEYADTRTFWVEPATGAVVWLHDEVRQQFSHAGKVVPAMSASLVSEPLPDEVLRDIRTGAAILPWIRGRASIVLVVIAAALLLALRRSRSSGA